MELTAELNLSCWYLNRRRIIELTGPMPLRYEQADITQPILAATVLGELKGRIVDLIREKRISSLPELLISGELRVGSLFVHAGKFYCKGLREYLLRKERGGAESPLPIVYTKITEFGSQQKLILAYHSEHLTAWSSRTELTGTQNLVVVGFVKDMSNSTIEATPYLIGALLVNWDGQKERGLRWSTVFEVPIDNIDSFEKVRDVRRFGAEELARLRTIPEQQVKILIAEILGEATVPKDWGGERSDLFSTHVRLCGGRISAAFAFKGPSKFHPMTMADLGKNGDQIGRLFTEPAQLLALQHCHEVTPPVRAAMRAYAQRIGDPRQYCVIDGYDTLRIIQAYRPELLGN